jgi:hypothetical protein
VSSVYNSDSPTFVQTHFWIGKYSLWQPCRGQATRPAYKHKKKDPGNGVFRHACCMLAADYWIVPVVMTERGLASAVTAAWVIGLSPPVAPIVYCETKPTGPGPIFGFVT